MNEELVRTQISLGVVRDGERGEQGESGKMYYASCPSTSQDAAKQATCDSSINASAIGDGFVISVTFTNSNISSFPTLEIVDQNSYSIGPFPIITNGLNEAYWDDGSTVIFALNDNRWYTSSTPVYGSNAIIGNLADRYIEIDEDSIDLMHAGDEKPLASFGEETVIRSDGALTRISNGMAIKDETEHTYFDIHKELRRDIDHPYTILTGITKHEISTHVYTLDYIYSEITSIEVVFNNNHIIQAQIKDGIVNEIIGFVWHIHDYSYGEYEISFEHGLNTCNLEVLPSGFGSSYYITKIEINGHGYDKAVLSLEGDVDIFGGITSINGYTDFEDFTDDFPSDSLGSYVTLRSGLRHFRTINLTFLVKRTSSVSSGSNIASGTINSRLFPYLPVTNATGSGYYGDNPILMQLRNDGSWTIRNAGSDSVALNDGCVISLTYIIDNGYGGGSSSGSVIGPPSNVSEERVKDIVLSYDYISRDEASENYVKIEEDIEAEEIDALFYLLFD